MLNNCLQESISARNLIVIKSNNNKLQLNMLKWIGKFLI